MSFNELIILMVIALVLFGPEDLPDVARAIGKVVFEVKKIAGDMTKEFQDAVNTPSNVLKKTLDDTLKTPAPKKSTQEVTKTAAAAPSTAAAVAPEAADTPKDENATPNKDDEELLTYDEDPLAELPQDMVSYEK
ncbi:sec-independent protein translocase protein TatA/sec-independent protein translocase protein TatB [Desulfitobacterium sp. LBE]|uniref:Sec-independent protein translocase subunit TatA/TatB n=1 Tax=Desulfitobacterium sp. LBE TaxID=884086 RepID=UPI00119C5A61|nr:twin-arginine translocase TatA/TatE family subunit [Desulfitobacterium sp. LBE]TWH60831.1 sec-independent protein translocase protein TatA/sec-independent protein translocase protein TatB [Desulfitobacterium sp. LBE]